MFGKLDILMYSFKILRRFVIPVEKHLLFDIASNHHCCYVRAFSLFPKAWAAAAHLSSIISNDRVGSMVSDDVVDSLAPKSRLCGFQRVF